MDGRQLSPEISRLFDLAKTDHAGFELARKKLLEKEISTMAGGDPLLEKRLNAAQWKIDKTLSLHASHVGRYIAVQKMFWRQLEKFRGTLDNISKL